MKHTAPHPLPVNNGFGVIGTPNSGFDYVQAWCARCCGAFDVDADWVTRYVAYELGNLDRDREGNRYSLAELDALERALEQQQRAMLDFIEGNQSISKRRPRWWNHWK